jgi:hypothetical protein
MPTHPDTVDARSDPVDSCRPPEEAGSQMRFSS